MMRTALATVGTIAVLALVAAFTVAAVRTPPAALRQAEAAGEVEAAVVPGAASRVAAVQRTTRVARYLPWAEQWGPRAGIPARALAAYAAADVAVREESPGCRLNWATLAGIGWVETAHGTHEGARLSHDGVASPPIVGPRLDGTAFGRIPDTDAGRLDGDTAWDRAVGPLQFTPGSWARWASDGDRDGTEDPQDIDDAALAAARYLCASGRDLSSADGWSEAVFSYNHSNEYVQQVYAAAQAYATRTRSR